MTVRRKFLRNSILVGLGAPALLKARPLYAQTESIDLARVKEWPTMKYTTLGRTNFKASRLV